MELVGVSIRLETEIDGQRILFLMIPNPFIICQRDLIQGKNARSEFQKQRDTGGEMSEIRPSVISFDCYFGIRNFPFITNPGRLTVKQPTMYCPGLQMLCGIVGKGINNILEYNMQCLPTRSTVHKHDVQDLVWSSTISTT